MTKKEGKEMYVRYDKSYGMPNTIYRSISDIRSDIEAVSERINTINKGMDLRTLLMDVMTDERGSVDPDFWIPELSRIIDDAERSKVHLVTLEEEMNILREELTQTQWATRGF